MITVISATNRNGSKTEVVATACFELVQKHTTKLVKLFKLIDLPEGFVHKDMYDPTTMHPDIKKIQSEYIFDANKLVIVVPEYNGGLPGIFKLFLDAISIHEYARNFKGKKVMLIGVSAGRAGNARGMDYLTNALNYLGMEVFPKKLPLSQINGLLNGDAPNEDTRKLLDENLQLFVSM